MKLTINQRPLFSRFAMKNLTLLVVCGFLGLVSHPFSFQNARAETATDFFESKVRPLLVARCYECHSAEADESSGNLRLDNAVLSRKGGDRGAAVVPGNVDASLMIRAISYADPDMEMPPSGKLPDEEIRVLQEWIASGATDPRDNSEEEPATAKTSSPFSRDAKTHWAYVMPLRASAPLQIADDCRDVIDAVAVATALTQQIRPSLMAGRETLIRRLYFDLAGLVPCESEIVSFVNSKHPAAYDRVVDLLLASPEFGERFGRHWMDVARYADTVGYQVAGRERRLLGSERFRDWVIRSYGQDMPYDEMVRHQLCGDRTDPQNSNGNLDAMGFLTIGRAFPNRFDLVDDRIDVITRGLLGMTVACARCHDHKFDPIPTQDYYSLAGIMFSSEEASEGASPLMLKDSAKPHDEHVMLRGQPGNRGEVAPRQFLTALRKPDEARFNDGSGRAELAERIVATSNPLTYRVMANRIWAHLVGMPLVDTPSDFGFRTQPPAVPAILDDLAAEFAEHRSIKKLVRRIVMTSTYQRSIDADTASIERDPDNRYLMRGNLRRRDFESLRDSMLQVSGMLEVAMGGEPVDISVNGSRPRRTVYAFLDRQNPPGLFRTFDVASPDTHTPSRHYTTIPQQALFLLNSPLMIETSIQASDAITSSLGSEASSDSAWVESLFVRILGRRATEGEREIASRFLATSLNSAGPKPESRRLWQYGLATLDPRGFVLRFDRLATFEKNNWQYSSTFPDPTVGYAKLSSENGHPGNGLGAAVVRRWTSPGDGAVTVNGVIGHQQMRGDGIRATMAIGDAVHWQEVQKMNNRPYGPMTWPIKKGQSLDLIADDNGTADSDSFFWRTSVRFVGDDGTVIESSSVDDFSGPLSDSTDRPLSRREQLAQLLLLSNEFAFVD